MTQTLYAHMKEKKKKKRNAYESVSGRQLSHWNEH
jgi:hypothetical protein